jgi:Tfp pilus assembly protein FimT
MAFTLIESLIAITIAISVLIFFIPSLKNVYQHQIANLVLTQLIDNLNFARNAARTTTNQIILCGSAKGKQCDGSWVAGQLILMQDENDKITETVSILQFTKLPKPYGILNWQAFPAHKEYIQFANDEIVRSYNGTFWYCYPGTNSPIWAVVINTTARTRIIYPKKNEIIKDARGKSLVC